jgi:hypothetical protein
MMGGSTKTTQASSSEPWAAAQPILKQGLNDAQALYSNGQSFKPFMGSTVVPYSAQTQQAQNDTIGAANYSQPTFNANWAQVSKNALNGGLNDTQRGVVSRLTGQATGPFNANDNPGFQSVLNQALDSAGNAVNLNASAAGRYGSGTHESVAGKTAGDITGNMVSQEYNDWKNRRDAANSSLFNAGQQQQNNINASGDVLSNAYNNWLTPSQSRAGVGAQQEDLAGRTLNDQLRMWQGQQDAPKNALQWLQAIGSGAGSLGGTGSTTAQGPSASPLGQGLGGLIGLNSLFG